MAAKILLVEDDRAIAEMVSEHLTRDGFTVRHIDNGTEAMQRFAGESPDLILLDLMLPGIDGMELLRRFRETSYAPVLIISARGGDLDKALGLGFGADDYLAKPFSMIELSARVKAALRRATQYSRAERQQETELIQVHELAMDPNHYYVAKRGEEIKLTAKEFEILKLLMTNPKRAYSKEQIYRIVWQDDYYGDENAIHVQISRLREKIEDDPSEPRYIKTVWGIGYKLGEF